MNAKPRRKARKLNPDSARESAEVRKAERHARAKRTLYLSIIIAGTNKPSAMAKILAQKYFESPSNAGWEILSAIARHKDDLPFVAKMLAKFGEYIEKGKPIFDELEVDAADMLARLPITTPVAEIARKLKKRHPKIKTGTLKQTVYRLRRILRQEDLV
jgi:G:T/U-mismatch repair DNA glycosylase